MQRPTIDQATKQSIKQYLGIDIDSELFNPTVDFAFKRIFTADEVRSKIALLDFLNSIMEFEGEDRIEDITVINPDIPVDIQTRKKSIFDIRARYNNGQQAIIEMQINNNYDFTKRSQFIISKAYASQDIAGLDYNALKKCYLVCITNFILFADKQELVSDYRYRDRQGADLTDDQTIVYMELPKVNIDKPITEMSNIEMWAIFFRYVTDTSKREILNSIIGKNGGIDMATKVLSEISKSEQERIQYECEMLWELDKNTRANYLTERARLEGKMEGKMEGIEEKSYSIAKNLLTIGLPIDQISKVVGLPIQDIQSLTTQ